ncbi:MAG: YggT family protein [Holosporaceae bacterium]|jgi:uncharacterized protein YggT (Ycf19 family)|nr:YggT family protein [Holosporaceae bacterium]
MDIICVPILLLIKAVVGFSIVMVVSDVIMSWISITNILNKNNQFIYMVTNSLSAVSAFLLGPIRRRMPCNMGSLDLSPVVFILLASYVEWVVDRILLRFAM